MPELHFSSLLDKSDSSSTGGSFGGQFLAVRGIVNDGGDTGERSGMDVCWENSGTDVVNHLTRYWECWDSSDSYRARVPDLQPKEWETMDGKIALTDCRATSKEALSISSQSSTLDFSIMSKSSDSSNVTTEVQDFGIGKTSDQKRFLLDGHCISDSNGGVQNFMKRASDIDLIPNCVKEIKQKPQNIPFLMHRKCETEGMTSLESGNITNGMQLSQFDQGGTKFSVHVNRKVAEKTVMDTHSDGSVGMGAIDESSIVLKLGKHTYPEGMAASGNKATSSAEPSLSKKQKASSSVTNAPRCQAEECKVDLLTTKDYYRKHKVCESHSKASKVKIGDREQRFCQQCSRFHLLEEFDEGKRSCRRRLAGHNERRRKSQPVTVPLLTGENLFFSSDGKYSSIGCSEWSCFLEQLHAIWPPPSTLDQVALACQRRGLAFADTESLLTVLSHPAAEQILRLLWSPEGHAGNWAHHEIQPIMEQGSVHSKSLDTVHPYLDVFPAYQSFKGTSDSRCALSLLSTPCLSSSAHCSMPFPLSGSFELFPSNNQVMPCQQVLSNASSGEKSHFGHVSNKLMAATSQPHSLNGSHVRISGSVDVINKEQYEQKSFGDGSILLMPQGNEFHFMQRLGSQDGPRTIELKHIPASQSQGSQLEVMHQSWKGQFSEFEGLKAYEAMLGR